MLNLLRGGVRDGVTEVVELVERFLDGVLVQVEAAQCVHDPDDVRASEWWTKRKQQQQTTNIFTRRQLVFTCTQGGAEH